MSSAHQVPEKNLGIKIELRCGDRGASLGSANSGLTAVGKSHNLSEHKDSFVKEQEKDYHYSFLHMRKINNALI